MKKEDRYCDFCQKSGHIEEKCWKKYGKPDWASKKESSPPTPTDLNALATESGPSSTNAVTLTRDDCEHLLKLTHGDATLPSASIAHVGISSSIVHGIKWLVDSRATNHMSSHMHLFSTYVPFWTPMFITLADRNKVTALGKGNVTLNSDLVLYDVLPVPFFSMILVLVKKLCSHSYRQVIFTNTTCVFQDMRSKKVIRGLLDSTLYYLRHTNLGSFHTKSDPSKCRQAQANGSFPTFCLSN